MQTELTIQIDNHLSERIKAYADRIGKSVSQIVAEYFVLLDKGTHQKDSDFSPITDSLKGCLRNTEITEEDYRKYLEEKYSR
jgi:hypothetical protein